MPRPSRRVPGVAPARRDTVPLGLIEVVLIEVGMPKWAVRYARNVATSYSCELVHGSKLERGPDDEHELWISFVFLPSPAV